MEGTPVGGVQSLTMRIRQYAYLALKSEELSPDAITSRLGMVPDDVSLMASRRQQPPVPAAHSWIASSKSTGPVDEMIAELITRLRPCAHHIQTLVSTGAVNAVLQVVRHLDDAEGESEDLRPRQVDGHLLEKFPGQHQLLGFHLDAETLRFLADTGIEIDLDEYG
jgi:hypothetical protein